MNTDNQNLAPVLNQILESISRMEGRFESIDKKFENIDRRFDSIDTRFEKIDRRFDSIDTRFEKIDTQFNEVKNDLAKLWSNQTEMDRKIGIILDQTSALIDNDQKTRRILDKHEDRMDIHDVRISVLETSQGKR